MSKNNNYRERRIRLSQSISPFGVGAVYDFRDESLVAADTRYWQRKDAQHISSPRLAASLGVRELRQPRTYAKKQNEAMPPHSLPFVRFPKWTFCPSCYRMRYLDKGDEPFHAAICLQCRKAPVLVPMRFIMICDEGHLDDFPWLRYAHLGNPMAHECSNETLKFVTKKGTGYGLDSLWIQCSGCDRGKSLRGITDPGLIDRMKLKCRGMQPWEDKPKACTTEKPIVVQRGATNVYFSEVRSAIEIPEDTHDPTLEEKIRSDTWFGPLEQSNDASQPDNEMRAFTIGRLARKYNVNEAFIEALLNRSIGPIDAASTEAALLTGEWGALSSDAPINHKHLITRPQKLSASSSAHGEQIVASVVPMLAAVDRLREVRAFVSFSRVSPEGKRVETSSGKRHDWLPAVEIFGEGVFIVLDEAKLAAWEHHQAVLEPARTLEARRQASLFGERLVHTPITPRFLLLHTLSHLLIRELAFGSGYAASSLRERIYAKPPNVDGAPQSGILIYTAAGDAEGTLGGLARQAEPARFSEAFLSALERGYWCSADPVCRESRGQGFNALNLGACHACTLLAETSCAHGNAFLDRNTLLSLDGTGFFDGVVQSVLTLTQALQA